MQGQRTEPLQFVVSGPNLHEMGRLATEIQRNLQSNPAIGRMDTDLQLDLPQLVLAPDRTRALAFGLTSHRRRAGAEHADRRRRHRQVQRRAERRPALRHPREGDGRRVPAAVRPLQDLPAQPPGTADPPGQRRDASRRSLGPAVISHFDLQYAATFYNTPTVSLGDAIEIVQEGGARTCRSAIACSSSARPRSSARRSASSPSRSSSARCCCSWCWPASSTRSCSRW